MTVVEGHRSADGFTVTARVRATDGTPWVFTASAETMEEAVDKLSAQLDRLLEKMEKEDDDPR